MMHEWGYTYGYGVGPIGMFLIAALIALPMWRICVKAGHPGIMALLMFVPVVNLVFLYWFAFADWPSQRSTPPTR
jgi:hypothetical protein